MKDETEDRERRELPLDVLLSRVGLVVSGLGDTGVFDPFRDPIVTDQIGQDLAHRMRGLDPNVVCVWEEPADMILAHVVARELGLGWVRCVNSDGLAAIIGPLPRSPRAALVSSVALGIQTIRAIQNLLAVHGGGLVGVGVLVGTEQLDEVASEVPAVVSLARSAAS